MIKIAYEPIYRLDLPEGHRFPMEKYELLPQQLLYEGTVTQDSFFAPGPIEEEYILWTHEEAYWNKLKHLQLTPNEIRAIGFPINEHFIKRTITIANGTLKGSHYAMQYGVAFNAAGGTHHSFTNRGEGFCLLNDVGITSNYLLRKGIKTKILVVDLDVHQGNGTAQIFKDEPRVFTFSMHGERNYPHRKEKSDLDIELPDGTDDLAYLEILYDILPKLIVAQKPDFIFYNSGVDVLETDKLGRLKLSKTGCKERDRFVLQTCKDNSIPVMVSMGGGYSTRIADIVDAHANTYRVAVNIFD